MPEPVAANLTEHCDRGVITWTLDAPARKNAVSPDALRYIQRRCAELSGAVVVLRGAGSESFCAGFDLAALGEAPTPATGEQDLPDAPLIAATRAMRDADATFIAAIEGYAIGAGVELACACDLRLAKQGAWFQVPAARLGVVYHAEGLARIRN
ncbi:MAG: enoyl-CoA hydratase/isomerase family protein, partial [Nannocystaceae bacterium]|nr:enoyl-CoA hydratase/isomerase family protein [Nannocystaceae bacterium]